MIRRFRFLAVVAALAAAVGAVPAPVGADEQETVRLSAGQEFRYASTRPTAGAGTPAVTLIFTPDECSAPPHSATCDVFPLQLERDESEGALNFVLMELDFDPGQQYPDLALVVAGLGLGHTTDYELWIWERDADGDWARRADLGGAAGNPELAGFEATESEYAITVQHTNGHSLGYDLSIKFSNELFTPPFESLDPALRDPGGAGFAAPVDRSSGETVPAPAPVDLVSDDAFSSISTDVADDASPSIAAPLPIATDTDFSGFRGSVDDALTGGIETARPTASVRAAVPDPPATAVALFWLLVLPLLLLAGFYAWMRRRRPQALTA